MNVDLAPQKSLFPEVSAQTKLHDLTGSLFERMKFSIEDVQFLRYYTTTNGLSFQAFSFLKEQSNH